MKIKELIKALKDKDQELTVKIRCSPRLTQLCFYDEDIEFIHVFEDEITDEITLVITPEE